MLTILVLCPEPKVSMGCVSIRCHLHVVILVHFSHNYFFRRYFRGLFGSLSRNCLLAGHKSLPTVTTTISHERPVSVQTFKAATRILTQLRNLRTLLITPWFHYSIIRGLGLTCLPNTTEFSLEAYQNQVRTQSLGFWLGTTFKSSSMLEKFYR